MRASLVLAAVLATTQVAMAETGGPDFWDVTGVAAGDVLNLHAAPSARSRKIGSAAHDAKGLANLGCRGGASFDQWSRMSEAERRRSAASRWCRVRLDGKVGWVAGRFLKEGGSTAASPAVPRFGAWTMFCDAKPCVLEQSTKNGEPPTLLRIEPIDPQNARIIIERLNLPRSGTLSLAMDGKPISAGPVAPLLEASGRRLVMTPDDITAGLLRQMRQHKTLEIGFEGEARVARFELAKLEQARSAALKGKPN